MVNRSLLIVILVINLFQKQYGNFVQTLKKQCGNKQEQKKVENKSQVGRKMLIKQDSFSLY